MGEVIREQLGPSHPLARALDEVLTDLENGNSSPHTIRAYRGDLLGFAVHHDGGPGELTAAPVRAYLAETAGLFPATRKRKRAAVASFCRWAVRHELLDANPMDRIDTVRVPKRLPRPAAAADVAKVLAAICPRRPRKDLPLDRLRDRVLFKTAYVCGARAGEVRGLYVEDLDLRLDDERARVHGKGGTVRTVLLDDRGYVALLKLYLERAKYKAGPLFRASINGSGRPLSYDAAQHRWTGYCATAGVDIHQLRHAHATELIIHHTPKHASWLNQVEIFFSTLTRRVLRRGQFTSRDDLAEHIDEFVLAYDQTDAKPLPLDLRRHPAQSRMNPRKIRAALPLAPGRGRWSHAEAEPGLVGDHPVSRCVGRVRLGPSATGPADSP